MATRKNPFSSTKSPEKAGDGGATSKSSDDRPVVIATLGMRAVARRPRASCFFADANHPARRAERCLTGRKRSAAVGSDAEGGVGMQASRAVRCGNQRNAV